MHRRHLVRLAAASRAARQRRKPADPALWSPTDVSGLALWLKADAGTWQDAALTTAAAADGDVVGGWVDQSGTANNATQATTAAKPTLKLGIVNGLPVLRFDGSDDILTVLNDASLSPTTGLTAFYVTKNLAGTDLGVVLAKGDTASNQPGAEWVFPHNVDTASYIGILISDDANNAGIGRRDLTITGYTAANVWVGTWDGGTADANTAFFQNGTQIDTDSAGWSGSITSMQAGAKNVTIGGGTSNLTAIYAGVDVAEILLYGPSLSVADRTRVTNYLMARYGI